MCAPTYLDLGLQNSGLLPPPIPGPSKSRGHLITFAKSRLTISCGQVSRGGRVLWKDSIPGRVTAVCGNSTLVAAGCADGSVHAMGAQVRDDDMML
jgi:hypothetical protein